VTDKSVSCYIGTSGWHYKDWIGPFYPQGYLYKDFLSFYSNYFNTVEINNSFYKQPTNETLKKWKETVNNDFLFSVKANRYITHMKKLKEPKESLSNFFNNIQVLKDKLGPVLFQMPPRWRINPDRFESFLCQLSKQQQCAFEFRDHSWFEKSIYKLLSKYNKAFCIYELAGYRSPEKVTADYVYIRLHGPESNAYEGKYSKGYLKTLAGKIQKWMEDVKNIYCFFDNDQKGYAATNALALKKIMDF
jgi:uncharacterized protein YecE (DUF72 family)